MYVIICYYLVCKMKSEIDLCCNRVMSVSESDGGEVFIDQQGASDQFYFAFINTWVHPKVNHISNTMISVHYKNNLDQSSM